MGLTEAEKLPSTVTLTYNYPTGTNCAMSSSMNDTHFSAACLEREFTSNYSYKKFLKTKCSFVSKLCKFEPQDKWNVAPRTTIFAGFVQSLEW